MNTFEHLLPEIKDLIFEYITGKQLLQLSLVSTSWYDHIADSQKCMDKIKINIKGNAKTMSNDSKQILKYSKRKYQHLAVSTTSPENAVNILSEPGRQWKMIYFKDLQFQTNQDYEQMLSYVGETIQEIHFNQVGITQLTSSYQTKFAFPKMKILKLYDCDWVVNEPFKFASELNELYLDYQHTILFGETFRRILKLNKGLKIISLPGSSIEVLLERNITDDLHFNIETLIISSFASQRCYQSKRHHLDYFLKAQSKSIKKLFIADWMGTEILETIYEHLIFLEELIMTNVDMLEDEIKWSKLKLKTNNAILSLNFQDKSENINIFNAFTCATPMLKTLKTYSITQEFLDFGFDMLQNLEALSVTFLDAKEIKKNILPKLKLYSGIIYDHHLQRSIMSKTKAQRSNFENILYENFNEKCNSFTFSNYILKVE